MNIDHYHRNSVLIRYIVTQIVLFMYIVTLFKDIVTSAMLILIGIGLWQENHDDNSLVCGSHGTLSVAPHPS